METKKVEPTKAEPVKAEPKAAAKEPVKKDPNDKNVAPKVEKELTPEEKKTQAEYEKLEQEAMGKANSVNQKLARDGADKRMHYTIRNGEIVYQWVNTYPVRILSQEDLDAAVAEMR